MAITRTDAEKANPLKIGMDALGWVGEKQDQLDKAVGIGQFNVYNARHLLIDPVTKIATRLHPAAGVAANVGMEMLVPDSTLYAGKILKGIRGIGKVIKGTRPAYAYAGVAGDVGRVSNVKISKSAQPLMIKGGDAGKNTFPKTNPFPEDKTLSRLYDKAEKGWKPKPGQKVYKGDNFTGDARKLRKQGKSATEVSKELGVKVRKVDGIDDVQKLRGSQKAGDPLAMKAESALESTSTDIRRRITEVKQTPKGQAGFGADSKTVKALESTYGGKVNKHHGVGLQQIDFLYEDASPKDMKELTRYIFEELNEPIGSIAANRMTIHDAKVHRPLHNWLRKEVIGLEKTGDPTNIQIDLKRSFGVKDLKKLPIETRKKAAQIYFEHIAPASKEQLFKLQQQFIKGK